MKETLPGCSRVAIACGGTGGHLFPGLAVGHEFRRRGCAVTLLISPKEVDQEAVKAAAGMDVVTLPAVGLTRGRVLAFASGFVRSWRAARREFRRRLPDAVLGMGGFTSAPPVLVGKRCGAATFLHESNVVPGRANRWLSRGVDQVFLGFGAAAERLSCRKSVFTGTPVRPELFPRDAGECRVKLGLEPSRPVVLVTGGSQGARGLNELVFQVLPLLAQRAPGWQWLHLTGPADAENARKVYAGLHVTAAVHPFFAQMEYALGAATAAMSRAGASSLAELAALRLPAVLVPFPAATDNHQFHNASAFEQSGAARLLEQKNASVWHLSSLLVELVQNQGVRSRMQAALAQWHVPQAAGHIADAILGAIPVSRAIGVGLSTPSLASGRAS